jgi:GcrA cell cycle regulator
MGYEPWTTERETLLKILWASGETAPAIAQKLGGVSRSAVLGKIFRLRLGPPRDEGKPRTGSPAESARLARRHKSSVAAAEPPAKKADRRGKTLFELTNTCCRWPYRRPGAERYFFCGAPEADLEAGVPYCPKHMKRAYLVPPPRKEPNRAFSALRPKTTRAA